MDIETKLEGVLQQRLDGISGFEAGSEESKLAINELAQLMDRYIDIKKSKQEAKAQAETRKDEERFKCKQLRNDFVDKLLRSVVQLITWAGSLTAGILLLKAAITYEETGTISSPVGKKILTMLLPKW